MYHYDRYERPAPPPQSGAYLTAEEIQQMSELMRELRSVTLSRSTFKATCQFLARFAGETDQATLVAATYGR